MLHLTEKNFGAEVLNSALPVIVIFYANWCANCAMMRPAAETVDKHCRSQYKFCKIEIDESKQLAETYEINTVPTFLCFKDGQLLAAFAGLFSAETLETRLHKIFRNC